MKNIITLLAICLTVKVQAQKIFGEQDLIAAVKKYHPIARQAGLEVRIANAALTASRGFFDPVASHSHNRKLFDGVTYYRQQWSQLQVPTWYGVDIVAGRETINGERLNPEKTKGTINYVGVSVPVLQHLLIDKRRAAVQQAKIGVQASAVERSAMMNDLLQQALAAYWQWWTQYQQLALVKEALQNSRQRLAMVKTAYSLGERPAIDTMEALSQVQLFQQKEIETFTLLTKSRLELSVYLWQEGNLPYELPEDVAPFLSTQKEKETLLPELLQAVNTHPLVQAYHYQLKNLQVEKKLKFQLLLPQVNIKYNHVGREVSELTKQPFFQNNYQYGITMSVPLRLSEGRGAYRAAQLKIEQAQLKQADQLLQLQNKVKAYYTEWQQTGQQIELQQNYLSNLVALQRGEETKFRNGESSLFLINTREQKTIEGQQKLYELFLKNREAAINLQWAAGWLGSTL